MSMYADDETLAYIKKLEGENAALLVAIEAKDAALEKIACVGNGNSHGNSIGNCMAIEALALAPSTELLEQRDRKRDAKLLRLIADYWRNNQLAYPNAHINVLADNRESGEWIPELGD